MDTTWALLPLLLLLSTGVALEENAPSPAPSNSSLTAADEQLEGTLMDLVKESESESESTGGRGTAEIVGDNLPDGAGDGDDDGQTENGQTETESGPSKGNAAAAGTESETETETSSANRLPEAKDEGVSVEQGGVELLLTPWWDLQMGTGETVEVDCGVYTGGKPNSRALRWTRPDGRDVTEDDR